jgi:hypothetical protein
MNTNTPQIARPTPNIATPTTQTATPSSSPITSKPAFVPSKPAATQSITPKPALKPIAAKPAAKPVAKKAAKPAAKKPAPKIAAKKPAAKTAAPSASKPSQAANSNKSSIVVATVSNIAEKANENINKAIAGSTETIQVAIECGNQATAISKSITAEISKLANNAIAQNTQAFKQLLNCKTATDFVNLSNSLIRTQADGAYSTGLKLVELTSQFAKVADPLNVHIASATKALTKNFGK